MSGRVACDDHIVAHADRCAWESANVGGPRHMGLRGSRRARELHRRAAQRARRNLARSDARRRTHPVAGNTHVSTKALEISQARISPTSSALTRSCADAANAVIEDEWPSSVCRSSTDDPDLTSKTRISPLEQPEIRGKHQHTDREHRCERPSELASRRRLGQRQQRTVYRPTQISSPPWTAAMPRAKRNASVQAAKRAS